jgi:hypothetical protein
MPTEYHCPAAQIRYKGQCPVRNCIAHSPKLKSGCITQEVADLNAQNVSFFKEIPPKEAIRIYKQGVTELTKLSNLYYDINDNIASPASCPECHAPITICKTPGTRRCKNRAYFYKTHRKKLPFSLCVKPTDFWRIFSTPIAETFVKPTVWDKGLSLLKTPKEKENVK